MDDAVVVSRRVIEEVVKSAGDKSVVLGFYDIEKAFPRVCKKTRWKLLRRRGYPPSMIRQQGPTRRYGVRGQGTQRVVEQMEAEEGSP